MLGSCHASGDTGLWVSATHPQPSISAATTATRTAAAAAGFARHAAVAGAPRGQFCPGPLLFSAATSSEQSPVGAGLVLLCLLSSFVSVL